ncbi:unnamed protein product, partial [marine sediment metagenome]
MDYPSVWIVIPAYNEAQIIEDVLHELLEYDSSYNVIVVDDGSSDTTAAIAKKFSTQVLIHPINLGQGAALATGIEYALRANAQIIVTFDADGQMRPQDIGTLVDKVVNEGVDVALGTRFLASPPEGMPRMKRLTLKLATVLTKLTTGLKITDTHNG